MISLARYHDIPLAMVVFVLVRVVLCLFVFFHAPANTRIWLVFRVGLSSTAVLILCSTPVLQGTISGELLD
jgi:uncharacterized protein (DUF983 family)